MKRLIVICSVALLVLAGGAGASQAKHKPKSPRIVIVTGVYHGSITYSGVARGQGNEGALWVGLFQGQGKVTIRVTRKYVTLSARFHGDVSHLADVYSTGCALLAPNGFGGDGTITARNWSTLGGVKQYPVGLVFSMTIGGGFQESCPDGLAFPVTWHADDPLQGTNYAMGIRVNVRKTLRGHSYNATGKDGQDTYRVHIAIK